MADDWYIYNNSGTSYELVAKFTDDNEEVFDLEAIIKFENMTEVKAKKDLTVKIQAALDKAIEKVIAGEKARDGYLVVSDSEGNIKKIPAKDL